MKPFKSGDTFHFHQMPCDQYKAHVLHVFEDDDETYIVYKWYGKHKQWWHYEVKSLYSVNLMIKNHNYWKKKQKEKYGK